jgi:uncharacterized membrane protein YkvA (DUF1232 family)
MRVLKDLFVLALGFFAAFYLVNPTAGFLEFIPDVLPIVGNLDEASATALLLSALAYFGLDVSRLFGNRANRYTDRRYDFGQRETTRSPDVIVQQPDHQQDRAQRR